MVVQILVLDSLEARSRGTSRDDVDFATADDCLPVGESIVKRERREEQKQLVQWCFASNVCSTR